MGVLVMAPQRETWNRLNLLLDEVVEALDAACIPVSSQSIEPGPPSWSNCCDDGHAYIRIVRMHMVDPFPSQSRNPTHCRNIGALVEVGVLRCAPTLDNQGNPPKPEQMTMSALEQTQDMSVIHSVLTSHNPAWSSNPVVLDTWVPLGPTGGCVGGAWQAWIDVAVCPPECPTSPTSPGESP